jgi:hypothetical protein
VHLPVEAPVAPREREGVVRERPVGLDHLAQDAPLLRRRGLCGQAGRQPLSTPRTV